MNENYWTSINLADNTGYSFTHYFVSNPYDYNCTSNEEITFSEPLKEAIKKEAVDEINELRKTVADLATELNKVIARDQIRQKEFESIMNILKEKISKNE